MRAVFGSATVTVMSGHLAAIMAIVGPPTYPAPWHVIFIEKPLASRTFFDSTLEDRRIKEAEPERSTPDKVPG